jgi:roadblock/LC7 domain-containing protein
MKISEEILPVVIKKIKIGKKFLTKSMIEQIPWGVFIYYFDEEWHEIRYGVPGIFNDDGKLIGYDDNAPYNSDGELIGYIEIKTNLSFNEYVRRYNKKNFYPEEIIWNCEGKEYFIIWYDNESNLKKGYIDKWTANVAGVKLEQIYI